MRTGRSLATELSFNLIAAAALLGFIAACTGYSKFVLHPASLGDAQVRLPTERYQTGPSLAEVLRILGEDPEEVLDPLP